MVDRVDGVDATHSMVPGAPLDAAPSAGPAGARAGLGGTPAAMAAHGGPDAQGIALHDFSTNSNAAGPCPHALAAVQQADPTRYPDPSYTVLRTQLAALHGVAPHRIVLAASASEFIHRATALAVQQGARAVALPEHSYGDYAQAAQARGLPMLRPAQAGWADAGLQWACEPSSPLGMADPALSAWRAALHPPAHGPELQIVDCAYVPLQLHQGVNEPRLTQPPRAFDLPDTGPNAWQLWTPNKALGLTGVRAAYA
ncbi:MAG: hypothetical protein K2Q97_00765, partial [Burkholderiaceae bacterium]|nr:hypothetical protein [Burkholderiaceae bacterium]